MPDKGLVRLPRRERERNRYRKEILEAAELVFVRKGYHSATMEEIAQEAEFAVGTLYNFFKNKEYLYRNVKEKIIQDLIELLKEHVLGKGDPEQAIASLIELHLTHFEEHRGFLRILFDISPDSRMGPPRDLPGSFAKLYDQYINAVSDIFARGIREGQFAEMDPLYLTLCLQGMIHAFIGYWARKGTEEDLDTRLEKMKALFFRLARRE